jgi:hypothetical protein
MKSGELWTHLPLYCYSHFVFHTSFNLHAVLLILSLTYTTKPPVFLHILLFVYFLSKKKKETIDHKSSTFAEEFSQSLNDLPQKEKESVRLFLRPCILVANLQKQRRRHICKPTFDSTGGRSYSDVNSSLQYVRWLRNSSRVCSILLYVTDKAT